MKCTPCELNECRSNNWNHGRCAAAHENVDCRCRCGISERQYLFTHLSYFGGGVTGTAIGTGLMVATGSAFVGPILMGASMPLVFKSIYSLYKNERMTAEETAKDAALGASVGAITGPISSGGSALANSTSGVTKVAIRTASSSTVGAVSNFTYRCWRVFVGEPLAKEEAVHALKEGAVIGAIGGTTGELINGVSGSLSSGVGKAFARLGITGLSTAATDAGMQLYETGKVNPERVAMNTAAQLTLAASAETGAAASQRTAAFNRKVNEQLLREKNVNPEQAKEIMGIIDEANANKQKIERGHYVGSQNIHKLGRDRHGQISGDIGPAAENGRRGAGRVIAAKHNDKYVYVDHTNDHSHKSCKTSLPNEVKNPLDAQLTQRKILLKDGEEKSDGGDTSGGWTRYLTSVFQLGK